MSLGANMQTPISHAQIWDATFKQASTLPLRELFHDENCQSTRTHASASALSFSLDYSLTREGVDGLGVGGVLADVVPVELAEEVAAVPLGLVLGVLQHRRRHHAHGGGSGGSGALCKLFIPSFKFIHL